MRPFQARYVATMSFAMGIYVLDETTFPSMVQIPLSLPEALHMVQTFHQHASSRDSELIIKCFKCLLQEHPDDGRNNFLTGWLASYFKTLNTQEVAAFYNAFASEEDSVNSWLLKLLWSALWMSGHTQQLRYILEMGSDPDEEEEEEEQEPSLGIDLDNVIQDVYLNPVNKQTLRALCDVSPLKDDPALLQVRSLYEAPMVLDILKGVYCYGGDMSIVDRMIDLSEQFTNDTLLEDGDQDAYMIGLLARNALVDLATLDANVLDRCAQRATQGHVVMQQMIQQIQSHGTPIHINFI